MPRKEAQTANTEDQPVRGPEVRESCLRRLRAASPQVYTIISRSRNIEETRRRLYRYLNGHERALEMGLQRIQFLERANMRQCLSVFRNILSKRNERITGVSTLHHICQLIKEESDQARQQVTEDFVEELIHLFRGINGRSGIYEDMSRPAFLEMTGKRAALARSRDLDKMVRKMDTFLARYMSGLHPEVISRRRGHRRKILNFFGAKAKDWVDWRWHLRHVIRDEKTLGALVELTEGESRQIARARESNLPFGITPFYCSLMDRDADRRFDYAVRSQVIPPESYVDWMIRHQEDRDSAADYMQEHDTSPIDLVTRRYPQIVILKPYNSCPQICVYCQRNWEIDRALAPRSQAPQKALRAALKWIKDHPAIREVLLTGGDPLVLSDQKLEYILTKLSEIDHIERIRLGTRMLVTVPQRFTPSLVDLLARYHHPGKREIVVVSHIEHIYELTPEMIRAVARIRRRGISVYNQLVFTTQNSRRFESSALRRQLRLSGIEPYYTFVAKGKEETERYRAPIARLLQEKREEVRLFSGMVRSDHAVFNVPRLGKSYLIAWQDHDVIMIMPDGRRIYEFFPWERNISPVDSFIHVDVPIQGYLNRLEEMGEDREDYKTIWYYF
ncbi:KamA family radical SAM protein [Candidatus Zixiibacteriota bacterium]